MPPLLPAAAGGPNPQDGSMVPQGPCTTVGSMSLAPLLTRKSEDALPDTMGLTADREGCATDPAKQCSAGRRAILDNNRTRSNPPAVAPDCPPPGNLGTAERFDRDPTADKPGSQSHDRAGKWHPGTVWQPLPQRTRWNGRLCTQGKKECDPSGNRRAFTNLPGVPGGRAGEQR